MKSFFKENRNSWIWFGDVIHPMIATVEDNGFRSDSEALTFYFLSFSFIMKTLRDGLKLR